MRTSAATHSFLFAACAIALLAMPATHAGVLPEDRADLMYHSYDGGNVTVNGPSLLVRKKFGERVSVAGNYYVDMVTSASIDVEVLGASEYKEERTQSSLSVDYLRGKTNYNLSYIESEESDYTAQTASVGVSEDMFGDLTTVSLGYTRAWDNVFRNVKNAQGALENDLRYGSDGSRGVDHRSYRVGVSQIVTKHLIMGLNYESQTHEGQLGNPYRNYSFVDPSDTNKRAFVEEKYPGTRTTNAIAIDGRYFLPYRAAIHGSYRYFTDTWGMAAYTAELGYTHPWHTAWTFDASYRYHSQQAADFYSDLFSRRDAQNFMARDRNLATMKNQTIHVGVSYDFEKMETWTRSWLNKVTVNLFYDRVQFDFADFRDARKSNANLTASPVAAGTEPLYAEDANVIRFFVSAWF